MKNIIIRVDCTREHLEKAKYCGISWNLVLEKNLTVGSNCWIAVAVKEIFPKAKVSELRIVDKETTLDTNIKNWSIELPAIARTAIYKFDECETIEEREELKPFSFEIEIDEPTLNAILEENGFTLDKLTEIIEEESNLELV